MKYYLDYEFEYNGHKDDHTYELKFDDMMLGIRAYFDSFMVNIDGKDSDVWNSLCDIHEYAIDNILEQVEDWLKDRLAEKAYEEYQEWCDWYYSDEDESDDDTWK